jgi:hypothetical protein
MSVLTNAQEHFKSKLSGGLQKVTVPEWKSDIYFKPAYPFAVEQKIIQLQQQGKTVEALVETLIAKALDPEGKPMFSRFDKNALMNDVDPNIIIRVCAEINTPIDDLEDIGKNS